MLVRFWGTRGSLPVAPTAGIIRAKVAQALVAANGRRFEDETEAQAYVAAELSFAAGATYGGATSCVELKAGDGAYFICDMGSGLRSFGLDSIKRNADGHAKTYNFFLSHLHWDHIMGFPFFAPAFDPDATIRIHSCHPDAEQALRRQQEEISFPVPFDWLRADIQFVVLTPTNHTRSTASRSRPSCSIIRTAATATASWTAKGARPFTARTASTSFRRWRSRRPSSISSAPPIW